MVLSSPLEAAPGVTSSGFGCRIAAAYEQRSQIGLFLPYFLVGCGSRRVGGTGTALAPRVGAKPGSCLRGRCDANVLPPSVPVTRAWAGLAGTDGSRAGRAAGCEGIAAAAGTEAAVGFGTQLLGSSAEKGLLFLIFKDLVVSHLYLL